MVPAPLAVSCVPLGTPLAVSCQLLAVSSPSFHLDLRIARAGLPADSGRPFGHRDLLVEKVAQRAEELDPRRRDAAGRSDVAAERPEREARDEVADRFEEAGFA